MKKNCVPSKPSRESVNVQSTLIYPIAPYGSAPSWLQNSPSQHDSKQFLARALQLGLAFGFDSGR